MTMKSCKLLIKYRILFLNIFIFQCSCEGSAYKDNVRISQKLIVQTSQSEEQNLYPGNRLAPILLTLEQYNKVVEAGGIIRMNNVPSMAKRFQLHTIDSSGYNTVIADYNIQNTFSMWMTLNNLYKLNVVLQTIEGITCAIKMAIEILGPEEYAGPDGGGMTPEQWAQACSTQKCILDLDWHNKCDALPPRNAIDKLPIRLTKDQYDRIVHVLPRMVMHRVPNEVKRVELTQYGDRTTAVINKSIIWSLEDTYVLIPKMDVTKGIHKFIVTLNTLNETVCATKLVIEIFTSEEMDFPISSRTRSTDKWVNQCSTLSCIIDLDWKNKCDVKEKPHDSDCVEDVQTASSPGPNIVVTDNPFNDDEFTLDADKPFEVGDTVTYTCESKERVNTTIQWTQRYNDDNTTIVALNAIVGRKYKLVLTLQDFDYNTNLQCIAHMDGKDKEVTKAVSDFNTILKTIPERFPVLPYNNSRMKYTCGEWDKTDLLAVTALVKENKIRKFDSSYHLTKNDNGSILSCLRFQDNNRKSEIQRFVHKKYMLIFQESTPQQEVSGLRVYSYIGVAVITILVSLLIAFAVLKRIRRKKVHMLLASQEADNHPTEAKEAESKPNLYSNVTLYAELDLASRPQNDRRPVVQDTTYAEITNPNTVLYAQLDLQDGKQNAQVEESPYAQIRH